MTPEEAIKTIEIAKAEVEWEYPMGYAIAFETAIKALEKQIPKTPLESDRKIRYCEVFKCPKCGFEFSGRVSKYCYRCGQKLKYEE